MTQLDHDEPVRLVRARLGAASLAGERAELDAVQYRLFHPALFRGTDMERQTGSLPPDPELAPWPLVILCNGINVGPESYRWLAQRLAGAGIATLTYSLTTEVTPGEVGLSPGLDLAAMYVDRYGQSPSATAIGPLLEAVAAEADSGPLAGCIDPTRVVLGGHSAGGTVALLNARPRWFPGVRGVFSYAGHTMPASLFGHPEGEVLPIDSETPALVMGGTSDGVVAASATRYGTDSPAHDPIGATFETAGAEGSVLAILRDGGHLDICDPLDPTIARGFLESPTEGAAQRRELIGDLVIAFCAEVLGVKYAGATLSELGRSGILERFRLR